MKIKVTVAGTGARLIEADTFNVDEGQLILRSRDAGIIFVAAKGEWQSVEVVDAESSLGWNQATQTIRTTETVMDDAKKASA